MNLTNSTQHTEAMIERLAREARPEVTYREVNEGTDTAWTLHLTEGTTTYTLDLNPADYTWRLTNINTYGNVEFVNGVGCDATGFVVSNPDLEELLENVCFENQR